MLTGFMHVVSDLGSAGFYIPLLVVLYWCFDPRLAARATVILSLGSVANTVLKLVFHAPRPYWTDPGVTGRESKVSFGMPSGHAQNAVPVWGFFATRTRRRILWAAAAAAIVLIGVSRVYLGVHSPGQVLAGWAAGLVLLVAALGLEPMVVPWWTRRPLAAQMAMALAVSLIGVGVAWTAVDSLSGWHWPDVWARAIERAGGSTRPITLNEVSAACGGLCGVLAGVSLLSSRGWFDPGGAPWRRMARLPVGIAGAVVLYLPEHYGGSHPVQAFAVHTLIGLWATAGAPEVFVRLGLARRPTRPVTRPGGEPAELRQ
ncbi:phosphatase PAP2 family protein [Actinomadura graeca]|uniref:Phosphatase PAP2 family protein n=1 Tax=Actinomadura graeca TaxID=2750812 RepID=A0ABX8R2R6_9ACTN|nr:phosphatase PAP2 family protein [Actinomadura graeca]QXJ25337.1 phosphatase PAP2 family protein [Actinomadura graeca]